MVQPELRKFSVRRGWIGKTNEEYKLEYYMESLKNYVETLEKRVRRLEKANSRWSPWPEMPIRKAVFGSQAKSPQTLSCTGKAVGKWPSGRKLKDIKRSG